MKCQLCGKSATVHLTDIIDQHKNELHLCETCARQHHVWPGPQQDLNLPALLQLLLGQPVTPLSAESARARCSQCGLTYLEFRQVGKLGCPHDYQAFQAELAPLLERLHRAARHVGKSPRRSAAPREQADLAALCRRLHDAVAAEQYETAAQLRDLIRQKEAPDEPG